MNLHWDQGTTAMRTAATGTLVAVADENTADSDGGQDGRGGGENAARMQRMQYEENSTRKTVRPRNVPRN